MVYRYSRSNTVAPIQPLQYSRSTTDAPIQQQIWTKKLQGIFVCIYIFSLAALKWMTTSLSSGGSPRTVSLLLLLWPYTTHISTHAMYCGCTLHTSTHTLYCCYCGCTLHTYQHMLCIVAVHYTHAMYCCCCWLYPCRTGYKISIICHILVGIIDWSIQGQ